jgi:hypothetical protein
MENPQPQRGAAYPIVLGSTLKDESSSEFMLVQYNFQPNTISRAVNGCLSLEHHRTSDRGDASHAKVCEVDESSVLVFLSARSRDLSRFDTGTRQLGTRAGKRAASEHTRE